MLQERLNRFGYSSQRLKKMGWPYFVIVLLFFFTTKERVLGFYDFNVFSIIGLFPLLVFTYSVTLFQRTNQTFIKSITSVLTSRGWRFANISASILLIYGLALKFGKELYPIENYYPTEFEVVYRGTYKGCWYRFDYFGEVHSIIGECPCTEFSGRRNDGKLTLKTQQTFLDKVVVLEMDYDGGPCMGGK
jgi:hypothetical protein